MTGYLEYGRELKARRIAKFVSFVANSSNTAGAAFARESRSSLCDSNLWPDLKAVLERMASEAICQAAKSQGRRVQPFTGPGTSLLIRSYASAHRFLKLVFC